MGRQSILTRFLRRTAPASANSPMVACTALLTGGTQVEQASEQGLIRLEGNPEVLRRLLTICAVPGAAAVGVAV
jgi:hypothetical protein